MGEPSHAAALAKPSIPSPPVLTALLVPIGMGCSEGFVQWEHLDACGDNSYLFHGTATAALGMKELLANHKLILHLQNRRNSH